MVVEDRILLIVFFFNDTATTEIYPLSLHDALPICLRLPGEPRCQRRLQSPPARREPSGRSEEHTSELQSRSDLVCRLLLEKKKKKKTRKKQQKKKKKKKEKTKKKKKK